MFQRFNGSMVQWFKGYPNQLCATSFPSFLRGKKFVQRLPQSLCATSFPSFLRGKNSFKGYLNHSAQPLFPPFSAAKNSFKGYPNQLCATSFPSFLRGKNPLFFPCKTFHVLIILRQFSFLYNCCLINNRTIAINNIFKHMLN